MNLVHRSLLIIVLASVFAHVQDAQAQNEQRTPQTQRPAAADPAAPEEPAEPTDAAADPNADVDVERDDGDRPFRPRRTGRDLVSVGHDSTLPAGEKADNVISVFGSSTAAGEVTDAVVSFMGDSRVTGPVGDSVVAVIGDVYINSPVQRDVVAVLGKVELGPQAEVGGDIVSVMGGGVQRDPAAIVRGGVQDVLGGLEWLRPWIEHCLVYGRPLALEPGLGWAWTMAFGFLALYVLFAFMFRENVDKCVQTFDEHPGHSMLTALLSVLLTPVLIVVLCITVVGIVVVPFLGLALFVGTLFGKAVVLAWIGRRCIRSFGHTALAVLVGGIVVLALYVVPVVGFLVYKLAGIVGFGILVYTLILGARARRRVAVTANGVAMSVPVEGATDATVDPVGPAATESVPPTSAVSATLPRAGFWIRMAALLIDAILVGVVAGVLLHEHDLFLPLLATYGALMWKLRGTTVGGIVCNLQVVRLDGREIDWPTAVVRALSCFLSLVVAGLGFIWMVFDDERQTWHDKIAGTVVVRVPKGMSLL
jgi:uncharacterized RDD family membrane protein YckC